MAEAIHCSYETRPDGIHRLTLHTSTKDAVDECFRLLYTVIDSEPHPTTRLLLLVDVASPAVPPLRYATRMIKQVYSKHPQLEERLRVAYLFDYSIFHVGISYFGYIRTRTKRHVFNHSQRNEAIAWLLDAS